MNKGAKSRRTFWCLLPSFTRYSLILLLSGVLLSESVGATPERRLQIAQLPATKPQNTKPTPSPIQPLIDKASQLFKEAIELDQQPSAASQRQAITKLEEVLKIWRLAEVRAVIPQKARSNEAFTLYAIATTYGTLNENTKALGYLEQALAISREIKDRLLEARMLSTIGNIYGINLTEYTKAVGYMEQAHTLTSIALNYQNLGETEKALDYYQQALQIYRQTKDLPEQVQTLIDIGLVYGTRGDRPSAEKYIQQGLELQKTIQSQLGQNAKSQINQIIILKQIASSYSGLGDTQQQIFYLNQGRIIGYLRLGDIFNLDFAADLVVLSACDTGFGKDVNGEGLVGLTRGLMYGGAERVVVSLWQVNDEGTAELMQQFYTQMLKQGKSPTVALRAGQLKLWQDSKWQNPYYWSAFTLQGEWR